MSRCICKRVLNGQAFCMQKQSIKPTIPSLCDYKQQTTRSCPIRTGVEATLKPSQQQAVTRGDEG